MANIFSFDEIQQLRDMGFTPEQIIMFTNSPATIPGDPAGDAPSDPGRSAADSPAADGSDAPVISENTPAEPVVDKPVETVDNSGLISAIEDLKKTLQASNIRMASVETVAPENELENIMAEIIRPNYKKGEG